MESDNRRDQAIYDSPLSIGAYMEQQVRDIGVLLLYVLREMLVVGFAGFVIGLLLKKVVKEGSDRLIHTIECFTEETRKNIEKLVESMQGGAESPGKNIARRLESMTEFIEHTGRSGADDVATVDTLVSGEPSMSIFVGNLAFTTTEEDLRQLFEPYGTVDTIRIMTDRDTGHARGFGFVEMLDGTAVKAAIHGLQGTALAGRTLTVNEAKSREPRREPRRARWEGPRR